VSASGTLAILDAVSNSGLGDLLKGAVSKAKDSRVNRMRATLDVIRVIVDSMDEQGKCEGKVLIKNLLDTKHFDEDDEYTDN